MDSDVYSALVSADTDVSLHGGIAAAETSILTTLGMTCEEYKTETGKDFDLSEKHLIWFASRPINALTNESQVGTSCKELTHWKRL